MAPEPFAGYDATFLQFAGRNTAILPLRSYARSFFFAIPARPRRPLPNRVKVDGSGTGELAVPVAEKVTGPFPWVEKPKVPMVL